MTVSFGLTAESSGVSEEATYAMAMRRVGGHAKLQGERESGRKIKGVSRSRQSV
jgi:hypothetical protein